MGGLKCMWIYNLFSLLYTVVTLKIQVRTFRIYYFALKSKGQTEHIQDVWDPMS